MTTSTHMPPLPALRGFESAARHESFRLAAEELCLSPSAISHQVRQLEKLIGQPLFERSTTGVTLTPCGRTYLEDITPVFAALVAATDRARGLSTRRTVMLHCSPGCAARWLMPRLGQLRQAFSHLNLSLCTGATRKGPEPDMRITCGYTYPPDDTYEVLMSTVRSPICSPGYLREHGPIAHPRDLVRHTLLREHQRDDWDRWFAIAAPGTALSDTCLWFDDGHGATDAAEQGLGVQLGYLRLVRRELAQGKLVQLFDQVTPESVIYTLRLRHDKRRDPDVTQLRDWLVAQAHPQIKAAE